MPRDWFPKVTRELGGALLLFSKVPGGHWRNITFFRRTPTLVSNFSSADPFGDASMQLTFPRITHRDDLTGSEFRPWYAEEADVDLWWAPLRVLTGDDDPDIGRPRWINPLNQRRECVIDVDHKLKVWEGFFAEPSYSGGQLVVQCQGALFQIDYRKARPTFPSRPLVVEDLMVDMTSRRYRPDLRTMGLRVDFPDGWQIIGPQADTDEQTYASFAPNVEPGRIWTGYPTRNTGSWDASLTGWMADQLSGMITQDESGVRPGDQWTIRHEHQDLYNGRPGRVPVLTIRSSDRPADFSFDVDDPGVSVDLNHDLTQRADVVYGEGVGTDGTTWRNAVISADGSRTDYLPLAWNPRSFPAFDNPAFDPSHIVRESYVKFGTGIGQAEGTKAMSAQLRRNVDPGWAGTITIATDPVGLPTKWLIRAGMTMTLRGFQGRDLRLHIASVQGDPEKGTLQLTVDTRYRDLLTVEESVARKRDALTPARMLQVNRTSNAIEDIQAPWDYLAGSGFIPKASLPAYTSAPVLDAFPHEAWWKSNGGPARHPEWFVKCNADSTDRAKRWAGPIPILTSEKGTIRRTELAAYNADGSLCPVKFHMSVYYVAVTSAAMPRDGDGPSPFIEGAFETINPETGQEWPDGNFLKPDESIINGWGNLLEPAGYSPGQASSGTGVTGVLVDEGTWTFDNTSNPNYNRLAQPGQSQAASAITVYAMIYAEFTRPVWFTGRLYRQPQGS